MANEPVELTIAAGKTIQTLRGRFGGKSMAEYSWRNNGGDKTRVGIRAVALTTNQELPAGPVDYIESQHCYVAFGRRGTPESDASRHGGYPSHAVFVGFIVFG